MLGSLIMELKKIALIYGKVDPFCLEKLLFYNYNLYIKINITTRVNLCIIRLIIKFGVKEETS